MKSIIIIALSVGCSLIAVLGVLAVISPAEPEVVYVEVTTPSIDGLTSAERAVLEAIEEDKRITALYDAAYGDGENTVPIQEYWERARLAQLMP